MGLLFSQHVFEGEPLLAQEQLTMASNAVVAPIINSANIGKNIVEQLSIEQQTKIFDQQIRRKYKQGVIIDVDRGVNESS